jgi:hypothetical protein
VRSERRERRKGVMILTIDGVENERSWYSHYFEASFLGYLGESFRFNLGYSSESVSITFLSHARMTMNSLDYQRYKLGT